MPAWELRFWEKKYSLQPPVAERIEWGLASLSSLTSNINRGKGRKARKAVDFMLFQNCYKPKYSEDEDTNDDIHSIMGALGGDKVEIKRS